MITTTTPYLAQRNGLDVPSVLKDKENFILVYKDEDLVAWGPEDDRENIMRLARAYE